MDPVSFLMWTPFEEVIVRVFQSYLFIETGDQKVVIKNSFWWIGYFAFPTSDRSACGESGKWPPSKNVRRSLNAKIWFPKSLSKVGYRAFILFAGCIELHRIKYIKIRPIQGMLQWYTKPKKDNNPLLHYCDPNSSAP